jgi:hypothetical protein
MEQAIKGCLACGNPIPNKPPNADYCKPCLRKAQKQSKIVRYHELKNHEIDGRPVRGYRRNKTFKHI